MGTPDTRAASPADCGEPQVPLAELLARERAAYPLPPKLRQSAEEFAQRALELLFPHFSANVATQPGDIAHEEAALRRLLAEALGARAGAAVDRFFEQLPVIREALLLDAQAICDGDPAARGVDEVILAYPGFLATVIHRLAHELHQGEAAVFPRLLAEVAHRATGIDIHPGARIGCNFAIDHGTGIVIGETAVLGDRVKLYQGVTLGAASVSKGLERTKRHPTIGDDVVIYANATILGGDTLVGDGSRIGGNVWLTRSVPPRSIVTPTARVDRREGSGGADDLLEFNI
jgi:serine O-acetyltransferase